MADGPIDLARVGLSSTAEAAWRTTKVCLFQTASKWGIDEGAIPERRARVVGDVLVVFVTLIHRSGGTLTFEVDVSSTDWSLLAPDAANDR